MFGACLKKLPSQANYLHLQQQQVVYLTAAFESYHAYVQGC